MRKISIIDTHADNVHMRLVLEGGPDLGRGPLPLRAQRFRRSHDAIRIAVLADARTHGKVVGALLCEPHVPGCSAGGIFFNRSGVIDACGPSLVGITIALAQLGWIHAGRHKIDTAFGVVETELREDGTVIVPGSRRASFKTADAAFFSTLLTRPGFAIHEYRNIDHFLLQGRPSGEKHIPAHAGFHRTTNRFR